MSHRSLEEQLEELLTLADLCPVYFRKPLVAIYFSNGILKKMAGLLICLKLGTRRM